MAASYRKLYSALPPCASAHASSPARTVSPFWESPIFFTLSSSSFSSSSSVFSNSWRTSSINCSCQAGKFAAAKTVCFFGCLSSKIAVFAFGLLLQLRGCPLEPLPRFSQMSQIGVAQSGRGLALSPDLPYAVYRRSFSSRGFYYFTASRATKISAACFGLQARRARVEDRYVPSYRLY